MSENFTDTNETEGNASEPQSSPLVLASELLPNRIPIVPIRPRPLFPGLPVPLEVGSDQVADDLDVVTAVHPFRQRVADGDPLTAEIIRPYADMHGVGIDNHSVDVEDERSQPQHAIDCQDLENRMITHLPRTPVQ